jgi:hypothetical protein
VNDKINPEHYKDLCSMECIEAMEIAFGAEGVLNFCLCNCFKYIWRYRNKNGLEDLEKATWYIDRAEKQLEVLVTTDGQHYLAQIDALNKVLRRHKIEVGTAI